MLFIGIFFGFSLLELFEILLCVVTTILRNWMDKKNFQYSDIVDEQSQTPPNEQPLEARLVATNFTMKNRKISTKKVYRITI